MLKTLRYFRKVPIILDALGDPMQLNNTDNAFMRIAPADHDWQSGAAAGGSAI